MKLLIDQKNDVRNEIAELERENYRLFDNIDKNELRIIKLKELLEEWNETDKK